MPLIVPSFENARVVVTGDLMLDRYWLGSTGRISPEAPVPVVRVREVQERPGGAANVAVNLASLGVQTTVLGITGDDESADTLERLLHGHGVQSRFTRLQGMPTVTKLRVLSRNQQLIRLDFESVLRGAGGASVAEEFARELPDAGVVILSDYAKGTLRDVEGFIAASRKAGVPVLVDPKGKNFARFRGASLLTPNLAEFHAVVGYCDKEETLLRRAENLRSELELDGLLITRSEKGMTLIARDREPLHLPAQALEVFDVTGAGDTVIAVLGAALSVGLSMEQAAELANLAAGLVVRKLGVASVSTTELRLAMHQRGIGGRSNLTPERLRNFRQQAKQRGERVVLTNGCFDIIHAGHIAYLEEAKALGDWLVVAVNDDDSVRRLKGDGRPVNSLEDRMAVLGGLAAVDWVVPFSDDTPEELICEMLPDLLVKGGDYEPEDIAGAQCVRANGGEVRVLKFHPGRSSTTIIDAIRKS